MFPVSCKLSCSLAIHKVLLSIIMPLIHQIMILNYAVFIHDIRASQPSSLTIRVTWKLLFCQLNTYTHPQPYISQKVHVSMHSCTNSRTDTHVNRLKYTGTYAHWHSCTHINTNTNTVTHGSWWTPNWSLFHGIWPNKTLVLRQLLLKNCQIGLIFDV